VVGSEHAPFSFAPAVDVWFPTGSEDNLTGDGSFRAQPNGFGRSPRAHPLCRGACHAHALRQLGVGDLHRRLRGEQIEKSARDFRQQIEPSCFLFERERLHLRTGDGSTGCAFATQFQDGREAQRRFGLIESRGGAISRRIFDLQSGIQGRRLRCLVQSGSCAVVLVAEARVVGVSGIGARERFIQRERAGVLCGERRAQNARHGGKRHQGKSHEEILSKSLRRQQLARA
jgi:hypothetical protein